MIALIILKYIFLAVSIVYTVSNAVKIFRNLPVTHQQLLIMGFNIAGYLALKYGFNI